MSVKILFATDGSRHSEMAAKTLVALRPPSDAEVFVLHVREPPYYMVTPAVPPSYSAEWHRVQREMHAEAEEAATLALEQAEQLVAKAGFCVCAMMSEGHPADEIIRTATEIKADLVVVGAKGWTGSAIFLLGSVAQKVVKYAPCSVLLTKPPPQPEEPKAARLILATDGSDNAKHAAEFLSLFHLTDDTEIVLVSVVQQPHGFSRFSSGPVQEQIRQSGIDSAQHLLDDTQNCLSTPAKVTAVIREGDPAEQILQASSQVDADLIVVGSKGLSGIKLFLLGSVSQRVCRYSDRSVLLVKMRHEDPTSEGQSA